MFQFTKGHETVFQNFRKTFLITMLCIKNLRVTKNGHNRSGRGWCSSAWGARSERKWCFLSTVRQPPSWWGHEHAVTGSIIKPTIAMLKCTSKVYPTCAHSSLLYNTVKLVFWNGDLILFWSQQTHRHHRNKKHTLGRSKAHNRNFRETIWTIWFSYSGSG